MSNAYKDWAADCRHEIDIADEKVVRKALKMILVDTGEYRLECTPDDCDGSENCTECVLAVAKRALEAAKWREPKDGENVKRRWRRG